MDQQGVRTMRGRSVTVNHSGDYLCRHVSVDGVRTHPVHADVRFRVGTTGGRIALCAEHAAQWRARAILAGRTGPIGPGRRDL